MKPSLAKGTRDFSPREMEKRNYIFRILKDIFKKFGYSEIQTPSFENLSTLTGKYGEEGDRLIFKILNSGDYLGGVPDDLLAAKSSAKLVPHISEKALRYDLTVPFARYVVMHQQDITLPFKRFQMQPVWRADRPQRGRYREFYQCDVDVVGSPSLLNEAEFVLIYHEALAALGLRDFTVKVNNRKILSGIADVVGRPESLLDMTVAIDKLDKIGLDGVEKALSEKGFTATELDILRPILLLEGTNGEKTDQLKAILATSETGLKGLEELEEVFGYLRAFGAEDVLEKTVELDVALARGLHYYTGCIFEAKTNEVEMGSIGGGGRYDDLTGMFGLKGLAGVGISFGAERIYDVLEELDLFPKSSTETTKLLIANFGSEMDHVTLPLLHRLRRNGTAAELYPTPAKLKKQMSYADGKRIPYVLLVGEEELASGQFSLKNMETGEQQKMGEAALLHAMNTRQ